MVLENIKLTLFFTAGTSLKTWAETGGLERELALYGKVSEKIRKLSLVTYGGAKDRNFQMGIKGINVLSTSWRSRQPVTTAHLLLKYSPALLESQVFKTNQIRGAQIPLWIKKVFQKKLIVRCGFLHSFFTRMETKDKQRIAAAENLERKAFSAADLCVVTSNWQREMIQQSYQLDKDKLKVIPNYVQTDIFAPAEFAEKQYDLLFVGRGTAQKNLSSLIEALKQLKSAGQNVSLLMVGSCSQNSSLVKEAELNKLKVEFRANVPSAELPGLINQARAFILPSLYEGHPKALLEAMSCGACCIGTNVIGIREDLTHLENGFLCEIDSASIAAGIKTVLGDESMRKELGANAREYIVNNYDIEKVLLLELEAIRSVVNQ